MADKRGITGRGKGWEWRNSLWIVFSFWAMSWIGFFYIGTKAKRKKWIVMGVIFGLLQTVPLVVAEEGSLAYDAMMYLFFFAYIAGIVLSFRSKKEYLICRDVLLNASLDEQADEKLRETVMQSYREQGVQIDKTVDPVTEAVRAAMEPQPETSSKAAPELPKAGAPEPQKAKVSGQPETDEKVSILDINACTEEELSALPGVSVAAAKKAVAYRAEQNGFSDADDFYRAAGLKPHFIAQLEGRLTCGTYQAADGTAGAAEQANTGNRGRKLDF